jgi:nitrate reductase gamma subunit
MQTLDQLTRLVFPYALTWFLALLVLRTAVVLRRGYKLELGAPKGSPRRGILYSLTFSMLPWKKDSTRRHPWTYAAGMGMHLGIFLTVLFALGRRFGSWPEALRPVFGLVAFIGLASALGLFVKRSTKPYMKPISSPDDFVANLLVQLYLAAGGLTAFLPAANPLWRATAILLLLYVPLGKIYHMLLFFLSRALFGLQFGRRGVLRHDLPISY